MARLSVSQCRATSRNVAQCRMRSQNVTQCRTMSPCALKATKLTATPQPLVLAPILQPRVLVLHDPSVCPSSITQLVMSPPVDKQPIGGMQAVKCWTMDQNDPFLQDLLPSCPSSFFENFHTCAAKIPLFVSHRSRMSALFGSAKMSKAKVRSGLAVPTVLQHHLPCCID